MNRKIARSILAPSVDRDELEKQIRSKSAPLSNGDLCYGNLLSSGTDIILQYNSRSDNFTKSSLNNPGQWCIFGIVPFVMLPTGRFKNYKHIHDPTICPEISDVIKLNPGGVSENVSLYDVVKVPANPHTSINKKRVFLDDPDNSGIYRETGPGTFSPVTKWVGETHIMFYHPSYDGYFVLHNCGGSTNSGDAAKCRFFLKYFDPLDDKYESLFVRTLDMPIPTTGNAQDAFKRAMRGV